ncbi:hypothetical protein [Streptomyces sp. NPDC001502]|uniref:hypothetical protein n=1 Tax=Streptomyces sp. NPDC001502 TaxID=3364578 RepID=UPI003679DCB2
MAGRGVWWAAVLVSAALVPVAAGVSGALPTAAGAGPALERVEPTGAVEVVDDHSCFEVTVKGHGFDPGSEVVLEVGTDQAMGVLRGAPVTVNPGKLGNFGPKTFKPCGLTTHGSTGSDHKCTDTEAKNGECLLGTVVAGSGGRWVSNKVRVVAVTYKEEIRAVPAVPTPGPDGEEPRMVNRKVKVRTVLAEVSWPLKVTGTK